MKGNYFNSDVIVPLVPAHKMPGGKVHTGKKHSDDSKPVSHKPGGPFKLREVNSPMKCWKTHKKVGMQNSPSGRKNPDGTPKRVNKCERK